MWDFACMIDNCEHSASSLLVAEIPSQKIQVYTVPVSGGQRRALWTGTAQIYSQLLDAMCAIVQVHSSRCGQLSTDFLAHLRLKHIVPCCYYKRIKSRSYSSSTFHSAVCNGMILYVWSLTTMPFSTMSNVWCPVNSLHSLKFDDREYWA